MPRCTALTQIPGISGPVFDLPPDANPVGLELSFSSEVLQLPAGRTLRVGVTYSSANRRLSLSGTPSPALELMGGQLRLIQFNFTAILKTDPRGEEVWDSSASDAAVASGLLEWRGQVPSLLEVPGGMVPLSLDYRLASSNSEPTGFRIALASSARPLVLPRIALQVDSLEIGAAVRISPNERVLVLSAAGSCRLQGLMLAQATTLLKDIFGQLPLPSSFEFRVAQRLSLDGAGVPGAPLGAPTLGFGFEWGTVPRLPSVPQLNLVLGQPFFEFAVPALGAPLPALGFKLRQSELSFPRIPAFSGLKLLGDLSFSPFPNGGGKFLFSPSVTGSLQLPELLRHFLDHIRWAAAALPSLDELPEALRLSLGELDFLRELEGLHPPSNLSGAALEKWVRETFSPAFRVLLEGLLATPGAPSLDRLIAQALRHFDSLPLLRVIWGEWFSHGRRLPELALLLLGFVEDSSEASLRKLWLLLDALAGHAQFRPLDLLREVLLHLSTHLGDLLTRGSVLITGLLIAAINQAGAAGIQSLARDLLAFLNDPSRALALRAPMGLGDLPFLSGFPRLSAPSLKVPFDSLLVSLGLFSVVTQSASQSFASLLSLPKTFRFLDFTFQPVIELLSSWSRLWPKIDATMVGPLFVALATNAENDPRSELVLLQLGRAFPPLGLLLALGAMVASLVRGGLSIVGDVLNNPSSILRGPITSIEEMPGLKVRRLPAPGKVGGKTTKYLILSDVHRDSNDDDRGAFEFGSIEHFKNNRTLYCEILDYAIKEGYTLIENGDCEELWFIRDFNTWKGHRDKLEKVLRDHAVVYERLVRLHNEGRYFRNYGNHDSYLRTPAVRAPLESLMQGSPRAASSPEFVIHDYLIIDGVKTMDEHSFLSLLGDAGEALVELAGNQPLSQRLEKAARQITEGRLGMDASDYTALKPLIVTHGHQWDFANCDSNNLIGKLIANSIGVPADLLNDPFEDLRGIAIGGSPFLDFRDTLAHLPVFDNFPSEQPAIGYAHAIQHSPARDRVLEDTLIYQESLAALSGLLTLAVSVPENGGMRLWSKAAQSKNPGQMAEHLFNLLAIGHTHSPHNQPYFNLEGMIPLPILGQLLDAVRDAAADLSGIEISLNVLKSRYLNSGTSGWMEGVVWGIQIEEDGQAHLVFWTNNTRIDRPNTMDWELFPMPEAQRRALDAKGGTLAEWWADALRLGGDSAAELAGLSAMAVPFSSLLRISPELESSQASSPLVLRDTDALAARKLTGWLTTVFLGILRRKVLPVSASSTLAFTLHYELPGELLAQISSVSQFLSGLGELGNGAANVEQILRAACTWLTMRQRSLLPAKSSSPVSEFPLADTLFALLPLFRPGAPVGIPSAEVKIVGSNLVLTLSFT